MKYQDINAEVIDSWVDDGWQWGVPISAESYRQVLKGEWSVYLTPTRAVPKKWFPIFKGLKILGLASGGGQQMPIFSALDADCTVIDYSKKQLASEQMVAQREGYQIKTVRSDISKKLPFSGSEFDLIFHPVSNCYIEEIQPIWEECYRVLKKGGRLLSGLDKGVNFLFDASDETKIKYKLPYNPLKQTKVSDDEIKRDGVQFSHTLDEQIRGQLIAGFQLIDLYEDYNGEGFLHEQGVPTFWATWVEK